METFPMVVIAASLLALAFFSGIEMAFLAANKTQLEIQHKQRTLSGNLLAPLVKRPAQFVGTTLVGHTLALVAYALGVAAALQPVFDSATTHPGFFALGGLLVLLALLPLLVVDFLSRSLFSLRAEGLLSFFAIPMVLLYGVLFIPVSLIINTAKFVITRIFRLGYSDEKPPFQLTDVNHYLNNLNKKEDADESEVDTRILNNALDFKTVRVRDCLVPRTELTAVALNDPMDLVRRTFVESGHSKVLVYQETIDNVIGYCHALELFKKPRNVASMLTPIMVIPETMLASELLVRFTGERKSLALVVDEFGGTSGLVSIEDVMEKIFGEIQDEYDGSEDWVEQKLDDYTYILSARQEIDYLNEKYAWNLPEGDYDTLGGFIISVNEDLPQINDVIHQSPFTFTILSMEEARIGMVKLTLAEDFKDS
ncbi:MAG: HlyC/CorC family transporter [Ferruginibacter sp.]|nr:HlyC/CorC family transporter [Cytophagales bacterium]